MLAQKALPSPYSQLTVSPFKHPWEYSNAKWSSLDSKQARDLVAVLTESNQQIDPRLYEMSRYGGGGGGGRGYGGRGGRGGRGGGAGYTGSNAAPIGGGRRW